MTDPNPPSFEKRPEQPPQQPYGQPPQAPPAPDYGPPPQPPQGYGQGYGAPQGYGGMPPAPPAGAYSSGPIALPQGVELASVGRRIGAYFLAIPLFVVTLGIGYIIWGLVLWGRGTTPALKVLGMKVWHIESGRPPGFGRMALRDILGRIVDGILSIITELISFIMFASGEKRQSLHDLVAGTTVVYDPNKVLG
jgi:uncharacterized RDD family membrane protein YckC